MQIIKKNKKWFIIGFVLLLSLLLRIQNLWFPIGADFHSTRHAQTAITIQSYFNDGWSLLHYETPVLGQPWRIPLEFPIYQSVVYFVMKIFHKTNIDVWCRLVSIGTFYLSVFVLKKVSDLIVDKKSSYCICVIYLFAPFTILWSRAALIDYMSVLFALIYVWGLYSWLTEGKRTFWITLVFGCLAYLLKATTMFPYVFFLAYLIIRYFYKELLNRSDKITLRVIFEYIKDNKMRIVILSALCIIPVVSGVCWTAYADAVKEQSVYASSLTSKATHDWIYGTMEQKLHLFNWKTVLGRLVQYMGGSAVVGCLVLLYSFLGRKKNLSMIVNCVTASLLTLFTLFNLYDFHDYYFIALTPIMSIAYGIMLFTVIDRLFSANTIGKGGVCIIIMMIVYAQINVNYEYLENAMMREERGVYASDLIGCGYYIASITEPDERIVTEGEGWVSTILYYADRKGMMTTGYLDENFFTDFLRQEKYTTLVAHSADFVDELAEHYDILIQYPGLRTRYIYKFYQELPADQRDLIKIKYTPVEEPITIDVEFVNTEGTSFHDAINLLVNKDEIYYNIADSYYRDDASWKNIQSIHFDAPEGIEISAEY